MTKFMTQRVFGMTRQDKTRQDKTRQDKTRQASMTSEKNSNIVNLRCFP